MKMQRKKTHIKLKGKIKKNNEVTPVRAVQTDGSVVCYVSRQNKFVKASLIVVRGG